MNPSSSLIDFCKLLDKDKNLQAQVKSVKSPIQIIEIAALSGIEISIEELRLWSKEMTAAYFPWSEMGSKWRQDFLR